MWPDQLGSCYARLSLAELGLAPRGSLVRRPSRSVFFIHGNSSTTVDRGSVRKFRHACHRWYSTTSILYHLCVRMFCVSLRTPRRGGKFEQYRFSYVNWTRKKNSLFQRPALAHCVGLPENSDEPATRENSCHFFIYACPWVSCFLFVPFSFISMLYKPLPLQSLWEKKKEMQNLNVAVSTVHCIYQLFKESGTVDPLSPRKRLDCRRLDLRSELNVVRVILGPINVPRGVMFGGCADVWYRFPQVLYTEKIWTHEKEDPSSCVAAI